MINMIYYFVNHRLVFLKKALYGAEGVCVMKLFFAILFTLVLIATGIWNIDRWYSFNHDIGNYLKLAGDAPSVERADEFLGKALSNIEARGLTQGNSAYFFHNPNADLSIWHSQIVGAKQTTASIIERANADPASVTQLERDNALMKIREVLLDEGDSGTKVTEPTHITVFPNQWTFLLLYLVSIVFGFIFWAWWHITRW